MKQRILALISTLCILIALAVVSPVLVSADTTYSITEGYYTYLISNQGATITACDTSISGDIIIPGTVSGFPVIAINAEVFLYRTNLTSVTLPDSITTIGTKAFSQCKNLTSITIPDSVSYIGSSAFSNCRKLTSVIIPANMTAICDYTFSDCVKLTSVIIPNGITTIGNYAFSNCHSLTSISIPDSVTSIGTHAFGYSGLTNIILPDSVTHMGEIVFINCTDLTSVTLPANLTTINKMMFAFCHSLRSITIPNGVTSINSEAFCRCTSLTSVIIPESVTYIGENIFSVCTSLTDVYYTQSKIAWEQISINSSNEVLTDEILRYREEIATAEKVMLGNSEAVRVTAFNIPAGREIILACYHNGKLTYFESTAKVETADAYYFSPTAEYDSIKVMVWNEINALVPVCKAAAL